MSRKRPALSFEIDKLTRSIENVVTGDSFPTVVLPLTTADLKNLTEKNGWLFSWKREFNASERETYKLTIVSNPLVIQGLVSLGSEMDHVVMHLVESAPFNLGRNKMYAGVLGNLVAFGCKRSFDMGHEGNLAFIEKTRLIAHYTTTLDAIHVGGGRMVITTAASRYLVDKYFPA